MSDELLALDGHVFTQEERDRFLKMDLQRFGSYMGVDYVVIPPSKDAEPQKDMVAEAMAEAVSALAKATAALAERDAPGRTVKRATEFKVDDRGVIVGKEETETWQ